MSGSSRRRAGERAVTVLLYAHAGIGTADEIAAVLGCTAWRVYQIAARYGAHVAAAARGGPRRIDHADVVARLRAGEQPSAIARVLGCRPSAITYIARRSAEAPVPTVRPVR